MKPVLVVMAAGIGSRYGGLKQLDPLGPSGELLLDYAVYDAVRAGIERVVFVIRRDMEGEARATLGRRYSGRVEVAYAFQELEDVPAAYHPRNRAKPWGTGHAVLAARRAVAGPFLVANADDLYGPEGIAQLVTFLEDPAQPSHHHALVAFRLGDTLSRHGPVSRGVCLLDGAGGLRGIEECTGVERNAAGICGLAGDGTRRSFAGGEPVSMNLWGFRPSIFPLLTERFEHFLARHADEAEAEFYLPHAITELVAAGSARVHVFTTSFPWLGVTARADREVVTAQLRELVARGVYPSPLWAP